MPNRADHAIVLASASPRRASILGALGVDFRVVVSSVEETLLASEMPAPAAERLARLKALDVARTVSEPIVAADTLVTIEGEILGKPSGADDASRMLRRLAGREHAVVTGICVVRDGVARSAVDTTRVRFAEMTEDEIRWYVETGEPMDKAGAYHIDGRGALFIASVSGSPSNVAGLPVRLLYSLARDLNLDLTGAAR